VQMKRGNVVGLLISLVSVVSVVASLALAVTGCVAPTDGESGRRDGQPKHEPRVPKAAAAEIEADLKIVECEGSEPNKIGVRATVEVVNSTSRPWRYSYDIIFRDPSGKRIATGLGSVGTVPPGETVVEKDIPGDTFDVYPDVSCEFGDRLERLPPR
jgi:hypothetical protein